MDQKRIKIDQKNRIDTPPGGPSTRIDGNNFQTRKIKHKLSRTTDQ